MKILVLGSNGQLGQCLQDQLNDSTYDVTYTSRADIDVKDFDSTYSKIKALAPAVVINCTAYTAVDKAESEPDEANLVNHLAVENLAKICTRMSCLLIHISTDYVFDGALNTPYTENLETNPQTVYGKTKLLGEKAIENSGCNYLIIRTAWVFSEYGNNFLKTMIRIAKEHDTLNIISDQLGCPTYAQDLAKSIVVILGKVNLGSYVCGIYNYCGDKPVSWFGFAEYIFKEFKGLNSDTDPILKKTTTSNYPTPAKRPNYSVLDNSKIIKSFDVNPSDWMAAVRKCKDRL